MGLIVVLNGGRQRTLKDGKSHPHLVFMERGRRSRLYLLSARRNGSGGVAGLGHILRGCTAFRNHASA